MLYLISLLVYPILLMHMSWILLKFHSGIFILFRIAKNRKFRESVVTARAESIFTVYGKMFSSCVCNSVTNLLQFHETVLWYWVRKSIGCAIPSDFAVLEVHEVGNKFGQTRFYQHQPRNMSYHYLSNLYTTYCLKLIKDTKAGQLFVKLKLGVNKLPHPLFLENSP